MDFGTYTDRQQQIIRREISILQVDVQELRRILTKAVFSYDEEAFRFAMRELERRKVYIKENYSYQEDDQRLIDGRISMSHAETKDLRSLLQKAGSKGDIALGMLIETELSRRNELPCIISGYTFVQNLLIQEIKPLYSAPIQAVVGLAKKSIELCDVDVALWADQELSKRKYKEHFIDQFSPVQQRIISGEKPISKCRDSDLSQIAAKARMSGKKRLLDLVEPEIERRTIESRRINYTDKEKAVLQNKKPVSDMSLGDIEQLYEKVVIDDESSHGSVKIKLKTEYSKKEVEFKARKAKEQGYTDRQKEIILGSIPLYYVKSEEIERLIRKAERYSDDEVAEYFRSELKARDEWKDKNRPYSELQQMILASLPDIEVKPDEEVLFSKDSSDSSEDTYRRYDGKTDSENLSSKISHLRDEEYYDVVEEYNRSKPYTARQMKLIDGTISLSEASNHELSRLVKKAKDQEDYETAEMIGNYLKMHRGYYRRADSKKVSQQPYSEDHIDIFKGKIPYEAVRISDLKKIASIARKNGDMKVLALMETLLMEKQDDKTEKLSYGPRKKSVVKKDEHWAMEVLESREDTEICTIVDLQNIKMFARTLSNPVYERVANFLIAVKRDPSIVYAAKTKKEAFDLIQKHTIQPIVWPEDW